MKSSNWTLGTRYPKLSIRHYLAQKSNENRIYKAHILKVSEEFMLKSFRLKLLVNATEESLQ